MTDTEHQQLIAAMQAAGLIIDLPWPQPPAVSAAERERLAAILAAAGPLSSEIIADRGRDATTPPSLATPPAAQPS